MRHSWYCRSVSALLLGFFSTSALAVPVMESGGIHVAGERYGIDQDGNLVRLLPSPIASVGRSASRLSLPPQGASVRYGLDQNGVCQALLPESAPTTPVAAVAPLETASLPKTAAATPAVAANPQTLIKGEPTVPLRQSSPTGVERGRILTLLSATLRRCRSLLAGFGPVPVTGHPTVSGRMACVVVPPAPRATVPLRQGLATPPPPRYSLLIDSLAVKKKARPLAKKLAHQGVAVVDSRSEKTTVTIYRLVVGTFPTREKAQECLTRVAPRLKGAYLISSNGVHGVYCGSWYRRAMAEEQLARFRGGGRRLTIRHESVAITHTTILAGSYCSREAARDVSLRLRLMGIPAVVVVDTDSLAQSRVGLKRENAV